MNPKVEIQEEMKEEKRTNECVLEGALTLLPSFFFSPSLSLSVVYCVYIELAGRYIRARRGIKAMVQYSELYSPPFHFRICFFTSSLFIEVYTSSE